MTRRILLSLAALLALLPGLALAQQINCAPTTPCTTAGPSGTGTGDPAYVAFGKANSWALIAATPLSITNSGILSLNPTLSLSGIVPVANGGTGTASPGLVAGANVTVTGTWPNQTISATGGGGGGISSIGLTMPAGFTVTGSPLTANGTLAVSTALSGVLKGSAGAFTTASAADIYGLFTSGTASTCLNSAGGLTACGASGTTLTIGTTTISGGTVGQILTVGSGPVLTQTATLPVANGGTGTASPGLVAGTNIGSITGTWPNQTINATGSVTSVGATVPAFLSVTGSPITGSGTLAISYSGTALPVANGGTGVTTSTGSGAVVLATSPTLTTPTLGAATATTINGTSIPSSATLVTTASLATPPAIGGTTPAAGAFTTLSASGNLTTNVTGSTQCLHVNTSGVVSGTGLDCGSGGSGITALTGQVTASGTGSVAATLSPTAITSASGGDRTTLLNTDKMLVTPTGGGTNYYTTLTEVATNVFAQGTAIGSLPNASALTGTEQLPAVQSSTGVNITPVQVAAYLNTTFAGVAPNFSSAVDITTPLTSAINAANSAGGGSIYIPPGKWSVTSLPAITAPLTIRGAGLGSFRGDGTTQYDDFVTELALTTNTGTLINIQANSVKISDIRLTMNNATPAAQGAESEEHT
jgi:hypothetical protein